MRPTDFSQQHIDYVDDLLAKLPLDYNPDKRDELHKNRDALVSLMHRFIPIAYPELLVGHGWLPLIARLEQKLDFIAPQYTVSIVKEKIDSLRFYANYSHIDVFGFHEDDYIRKQIFNDLIYHAENLSIKTCHICASTMCTKHSK